MGETLKICISGASTDTGNLGVSALCLSVLRGVFAREPDARVTVFDHGLGEGPAEMRADGRVRAYRRCGLRHSRKLHMSESLWRTGLSLRLRLGRTPAADAIRGADAVLDITGGDSFTDLYGERRFRGGAISKRLATEHSGGLVFLPQTYGPFRAETTRRQAAELVRGAAAAWARDAASFDVLRGLLGDAFDPSRHRCGVDVAFRLGAEEPRRPLDPELSRWLATPRDTPVVGLNVSGLTFNRPAEASRDFGFRADYRTLVARFVRRLLGETPARLVLVPHVLTPSGHFESDRDACEAVRGAVESAHRGRVAVAPDLDATEVKWLIARTDWFCGTRMHATIAALSSGVPTAALAYSAKTRGVFETCGQGEHVADLRELDTDAAAEVLWRSWFSRRDTAQRLAAALPPVLETADRQMDDILETCRRLARRRAGSTSSR
jgi:polysaccharide pyruvyl transferase WcaK-like protein